MTSKITHTAEEFVCALSESVAAFEQRKKENLEKFLSLVDKDIEQLINSFNDKLAYAISTRNNKMFIELNSKTQYFPEGYSFDLLKNKVEEEFERQLTDKGFSFIKKNPSQWHHYNYTINPPDSLFT